ncbi:MAG: transcription antitermination factor NusB [Bacteroidota bacterium]
MKEEIQEDFPLSKTKHTKGSRHLAREKVLQVICAYKVAETPWEAIFSHVFFRKFNFGDDEEVALKILTSDEVFEMDADIPIEWVDDEIMFARTLIAETIKATDYLDDLIKEYAQHWELERIAHIDRILMHMALTELMKFPEIPPKVSINEAIDIAKKYSTAKSGIFINGVLDALHEKLLKEGLCKKAGRGLVDN